MGHELLQADGVLIRRGDQTILDGVSVEINRDSSTLIQGPSGSGKTTLFNVRGLLDSSAAGTLIVNGDDVSESFGTHTGTDST